MFCSKCGTENDVAYKCTQCGQDLKEVESASVSPPQTVPNYLVWAILTTMLCCLPSGIASIVYAAQVNTKLAEGDTLGAIDSSNKAKMWAWISFGLGLAINVIGAILTVLSVMAGVAGY